MIIDRYQLCKLNVHVILEALVVEADMLQDGHQERLVVNGIPSRSVKEIYRHCGVQRQRC